MFPKTSSDSPGRIWTFAQCEWNEASRELRVSGALADLEAKPLDLLSQLLYRAGEVVTKEELLEAVWPDTTVVDGSLTTAISKLRKALGDESQKIVATVPKIGYRLIVPVHSTLIENAVDKRKAFEEGELVPGREQWRLTTKMHASDANEVWLARHIKTAERRVFKFAFDGVRLKALKREATLGRFFRESLGDRHCFNRILEWNFESAPFYLESEYGGSNLIDWADARGGMSAVSPETRLRIFVDIAQAVESAHELGVLHKDLKPANVLCSDTDNGWQIKLVDFGSGDILDRSRLASLGITNLGFTQTIGGNAAALTGTMLYLAPELLAGQSPTTSSDVYALGVMLYQFLVCDFRKPLSAGWEQEIDDPLLRQDIADAAAGDPQRRLKSAGLLAQRLLDLERRRVKHDELETERMRAHAAEQRLLREKARRPWIIAAIATLAVSLFASLFLYGRAVVERNRANHQTAISNAVSQFLANDLLGMNDPFQVNRGGESLLAAAKRASNEIDARFQHAPEVAARLHHSMARALDSRSEFPEARREYLSAARLFEKAGGESLPVAIVSQLQLAAMEARTYEKDCLPRARAILAQQQKKISPPLDRNAEISVWLSAAKGIIALIDNDAKTAVGQLEAASQKAETLAAFDETARLNLQQRLAFAAIRNGNGPKAEEISRRLIDAFTRLSGPGNPNVLRARLQLAQAFMIQKKHREAIDETTQIYPAYVAALGENHELSMQVLVTRATSEGNLGIWDAVIRDNMKIYDLAVRKQGPLSFFALATLSDAALAQCRAGSRKDGVENARRAFEKAREAFGERAGLTGGTADTLASCLIDIGKLDEASRLIANIDTKAVTQLTGNPDWIANLHVSRARIALNQGDLAAANKFIALAEPILARPDAERYQREVLKKLVAQAKQPDTH